MFGLGFILTTIGLFLIDCAVKGRDPVDTLHNIITDPGNIRESLSESAGSIEPTLYATGAAHTGGVVATAAVSHGGGGSGGGSVSLSPSGIAAAGRGERGKVVAFARRQIGKPYVWGAEGPNAYDCSGLIYAAYKSIGMQVPRTTAQLIFVGRSVKRSQLRPGDLVFTKPTHVVMYSGNGNIIGSPHTGEVVHEIPMYKFWRGRSILP